MNEAEPAKRNPKATSRAVLGIDRRLPTLGPRGDFAFKSDGTPTHRPSLDFPQGLSPTGILAEDWMHGMI